MLETIRLTLIPLDARQLRLWYHDLAALERELACTYRAEPPEGPFLVIIKEQIETINKDPDNWLWHTFWLLRDKKNGIVVGAVSFRKTCCREVEIGYAAGNYYRKKGYITEAVGVMSKWALDQPGITAVTAETETWNLDSHSVLGRCGFEKYGDDTGDTFWWRLRKPL